MLTLMYTVEDHVLLQSSDLTLGVSNCHQANLLNKTIIQRFPLVIYFQLHNIAYRGDRRSVQHFTIEM